MLDASGLAASGAYGHKIGDVVGPREIHDAALVVGFSRLDRLLVDGESGAFDGGSAVRANRKDHSELAFILTGDDLYVIVFSDTEFHFLTSYSTSGAREMIFI